MIWKGIFSILLAISALSFVVSDRQCRIRDDHWELYKSIFKKSYVNVETEEKSKKIFARNTLKIHEHNLNYKKGLQSYSLAVNQFTDLEFPTVLANFPRIHPLRPALNIKNDLDFSDSFDHADEEYHSAVQDQGLKCNSGWAYAAATALDLFRAREIKESLATSSFNTSVTVSAQQFIDCVESANSCKSESPEAAYQYLTSNYYPAIYDVDQYPNTPESVNKGTCVQPQISKNYLLEYSTIQDSIHETVGLRVKHHSPVIFEFNQLSFEFFHYAEGVFKSPVADDLGSHFMVIVGYGKDSNREEFWKLQNSFGLNWGEKGFIRLANNPWKSFTKEAIYPKSLKLNKLN